MNVLITGAASNIGLNVGLKLAKDNKVFLTVHTDSQSKYLKEMINNDNIKIFKLDITNINDYYKISDINIDLFIANAAVGCGGSILAMDMDVLRKNYEVNIFSNFKLIQYVYKKMENKGGKIFVMSSLGGLFPLPMIGSYISSKAAISMLTLCLQKELKLVGSKVVVSLIEPGAFYTGFNQVMIDNKEVYLDQDSIFYKKISKIDMYIKRKFRIIECKNINKIVDKIVLEAYKNKPKKKIRAPFIQKILIKVYLLLFR